MRLLAIETATEWASVALWDDRRPPRPGVVGEARCEERGRTSRELFPAIDRLLSERGWRVADLDGLALSIGPGSFTGLRIGVSAVKGLVGARVVPVAAVGTLDAVAVASGCSGLVAACLDAKRGEMFGRLFRCAEGVLDPVTDEVLAPPSAWAASLPGDEAVWCVGDGALLHRDGLAGALGARGRFGASPAMTIAAAVAALGARRLASGDATPVAELVPRYFRRAAAEVNLERGLVGSRRRLVLGWDPGHDRS
jgi:tRNA threonylcarbamoyladenosine biosynthesis protein TsaB